MTHEHQCNVAPGYNTSHSIVQFSREFKLTLPYIFVTGVRVDNYMTQKTHERQCDVVYRPGYIINYTVNQSIFVKTDYIVQFFQEFKGTLPYILVTGDSDFSPSTFFTDQELFSFVSHPALIEWRAQNLCTTHPKMKHLPIGLGDTPSTIAFCKKYKDELRAVPKKELVYSNFTPDNNQQERNCFINDIHERLDFEDYMWTMAGYKYVMCPMGNGIDTHRFWEAQVCGCIPIVRCPKEFLPTYDNFPYISLPGVCYARMGSPNLVEKRESIFVMTLNGFLS
jgi:hypothetical protein